MSNDVKALKINGVAPSEQTVADGSCKIQRPFMFLTKGDPTNAVKDFVDWVLGPEGQAIIKEEKVVPAIVNGVLNTKIYFFKFEKIN